MTRTLSLTLAVVIAAMAVVLSVMALHSSSARASTPTVNTSSSQETLVSPKCYIRTSRTVTTMHYDTKLGHYVNYVSPRVTTSRSETCHA